MTELERRALLGDPDAQKECTEKGIVLPCPLCGKSVATKTNLAEALYVRNNKEAEMLFSEVPIYACDFSKGGCGSYAYNSICSDQAALLAWNTRPAPPIGRCSDCAYGEKEAQVNDNGFLVCPASSMEITDNDFCSYFEPKEADHE